MPPKKVKELVQVQSPSNESINSNEEVYIDRIRAVAFKEVRDSGPNGGFITPKWVAEKIGRSESWVKLNWKKQYHECKDKKRTGRPGTLQNSDALQQIRDYFNENPKTSMTQAGIDLGLSTSIIRRGMKLLNISNYATSGGRKALSELIKSGVKAGEVRRGCPQRRSGGAPFHKKRRLKTDDNKVEVMQIEGPKKRTVDPRKTPIELNGNGVQSEPEFITGF